MIYLDNASTTRLNKKILENINKYYDVFANPSSIHSVGKNANMLLESKREELLNLLSKKGNIIFTSSATESNNIVIKGLCLNNFTKKREILISKIEHKSVINSAKYLEKFGYKVKYINVLKTGEIDFEDLKGKINENTFLISIMSINNETGVKNDLESINNIIKEKESSFGKIYFHSDITQSLGKILKYPDIDIMTSSFHKINGPKGVGFIYMKDDINIEYISGGNQENDKRAGTQNLPSILMSIDALKYYIDNNSNIMEHFNDLKNYFILNIKEYVVFNGDISKCINIFNFSLKNNTDNQFILTYLDIDDIYVSSGSACSSHITEPSYVLKSMNVENMNAIRVSFDIYTTKEEIDIFIDKIKKII